MRYAARIDEFIDYLKSQKGYSPHTLRSYRVDLTQFFQFLVEKRRKERDEEPRLHWESTESGEIREYLAGLYGRRKRSLPLKRHFLHAARLSLVLPGEAQPSTFEASLPSELEAVLELLRRA